MRRRKEEEKEKEGEASAIQNEDPTSREGWEKQLRSQLVRKRMDNQSIIVGR